VHRNENYVFQTPTVPIYGKLQFPLFTMTLVVMMLFVVSSMMMLMPLLTKSCIVILWAIAWHVLVMW